MVHPKEHKSSTDVAHGKTLLKASGIALGMANSEDSAICGCVSFQGVIFRQWFSQTKRESKGSPDVLCIVLAVCPVMDFLSV